MLLIFVLAWLVQLVLQLVVWLAPLRHARRTRATAEMLQGGDKPGVSILVYSHNQAEALARNLPVLFEQNYPQFEVIVIDDYSRDDTAEILSMMEQRSDHFLHSRIDEKTRAMSHRKLAVYLGSKLAHYDILLMTRAECLPASADWISGMVRHFANPAVEVVLGPVVYERRASFLSRFCQFDLFQRLLWLLGVTLSVKPFAGWGQNLAFRKETFYANRSQGFQRHLKIKPGEDDLFVADVAREGNVAVELQSSSLMTDQSRPLFINWSLERLDRGFTSRLYAALPTTLQLVEQVTRYLTVLPAIALIIYAVTALVSGVSVASASVLLAVTLVLSLARVGVMLYTYATMSRHLHLKPVMSWPVLLDLYMPFVDLWYRIKAQLRKKSFGVSRVGLQ